jgi:hypothetical protein
MRQRAHELIAIGDDLFNRRQAINSLWQATAEQFYAERADYTYTRSIGMEFASHLMTGVPAMASRDLANAISAMLRPPGQTWFHARTDSELINKDTQCRRWLDWATEMMRQAMYDNMSGWSRAAKEGDRDFVTIGNACIMLRPNEIHNGLLYRCMHMRDVAWSEDPSGQIDTVHVKRKIAQLNLIKLFPKTVDQRVKDGAKKDPHTEVQCRHIVLPTRDYDSVTPATEDNSTPEGIMRRGRKLPFTSIWIDVDHETILEEIGQWQLGYICPRWETVPGFGYGYSPPTVINIADARMLQQITLTLLEAGQKAVDPPLKGVFEAIQGGVNTFAGGITWTDAEYDERTGAALEPLLGTHPDLGWGVDREKRIQEIIAQGHYLNQIKLPDTTHARTAFEVSKLWEEYIRNTTPLFEPLQVEYNGAVCDRTFELMLRMNAFGDLGYMPKKLRGMNVRFVFETPLTMAASRANVQAFTQALQILQGAVAVDPTVSHDFNLDNAFRDALEGAAVPATWIVPKELANQMKAQSRQQLAAQQQGQQVMQGASQGADVAAKIGNAATMLQQGGILPPQQAQQGGSI